MNACLTGFVCGTMAKRKNGFRGAMDGIRLLAICKQQLEINCLHSEIEYIVPNRPNFEAANGRDGTQLSSALCMECLNQMEHENNKRNYLITWLTYVCIVMWFTVNHHVFVQLRYSIWRSRPLSSRMQFPSSSSGNEIKIADYVLRIWGMKWI